MRWWVDYRKHGALPWPGDWGDQPAYVCEVIEALDEVAADCAKRLQPKTPWSPPDAP